MMRWLIKLAAYETDERLAGQIEERSLHFAGRLLRGSEEEEKASARFGRDDCWLLNGCVLQVGWA
jgi:hypothetical protein